MNVTGSASITDYNTVSVNVDLDLSGESHLLVFYTYVFVDTSFPLTAMASFVSQSADPVIPNLFHLLFDQVSCYFDTLYYYEIRVTNDPYIDGHPFPQVVGSDSGTIRTQPCPSSLLSYTVKPYLHKVHFEVTADIQTNDIYRIQVTISRFQNFTYPKSTDIPYDHSWNGTQYTGKYKLTGLVQNKKYYFQISLICTSTLPAEQVIDVMTGEFYTLKENFPWWMYLRYSI